MRCTFVAATAAAKLDLELETSGAITLGIAVAVAVAIAAAIGVAIGFASAARLQAAFLCFSLLFGRGGPRPLGSLLAAKRLPRRTLRRAFVRSARPGVAANAHLWCAAVAMPPRWQRGGCCRAGR